MTDISEIEKMLYGNVEEDEDLMAELMNLAGEEGVDFDDDQPKPKPKPKLKPQAAVQPTQRTAQTSRVAPVKPTHPVKPERDVNFDVIKRLAKQISIEADVKDDPNDSSVEDDDDLLDELGELMEDEEPDEESVAAAPELTVTPRASMQPMQRRKESVPKVQEPPPEAAPEPPAVVQRKPSVPAPTPVEEPTVQPKPQAAVQPAVRPPQPAPEAPLQALEQRMAVYVESVNKCNESGDDRRARQNKRIVDQYKTAIRQLKTGKAVNFDELPCPPGAAPIPMPAPTRVPGPAAPTNSATVHPPLPTILSPSQALPQISPSAVTTREQLLERALAAKKAGDIDTAKTLLMQAKSLPSAAAPEADSPNSGAAPVANRRSSTKSNASMASSGQQPVKDVMKALIERQTLYANVSRRAKEQGDDRKARQNDRIAQQFGAAIRARKGGKEFDLSELPCPPGYAPLVAEQIEYEMPLPSSTAPVGQTGSSSAAVPSPPKQSRQQQQLDFLLHRQAQFKEAAIVAKKHNDIDLAKRYLVQAKGFETMITASRNGLPVDISNIPEPPQVHTSRHALQPQLSVDDSKRPTVSLPGDPDQRTSLCCLPKTQRPSDESEEVYATLEADLIRQVQVCERNQQYFTRLGQVGEVTKYERMAIDCKKDLVALRQAAKHDDPLPKFHYENRSFPKLECAADLGEEDMEIAVIRAVNVSLPKGYKASDADLYVRYECPYPPESHQTGTTTCITETTSPDFHQRSIIRIAPRSRQFQRVLKRQGVKFDVYQRGGFLRSDKPCGHCEVKLAPLESTNEVHASMDLLEGRRQCGGKLEVKLRIREPIVNNTPSTVTEKWLVIDQFMVVTQPQRTVVRQQQPVRRNDAPRQQQGLRRMY